MIIVAFCFLAGICTLHGLSFLPKLIIVIPSASFLIFCSFLYRKYIGYLAIAYTIGFIWVSLHAYYHIQHVLPVDLEKKPLLITGEIANIPEYEKKAAKFDFIVKNISDVTVSQTWQLPAKIRLYWHQASTNLQVGDHYQFTVKLKRPRGYANLGSFDLEKLYFQKGIVANGFIVPNTPSSHLSSSGAYPIDRTRTQILSVLQRELQLKPLGGAIIAVLIGIQKGISQKQWDVFRDTGTAHLMAISGLHVGLVSSFIFAIFSSIWRRFPHLCLKIPAPMIGYCLGGIMSVAYALIAGFSIPTQRATIMIMLFIITGVTRRWMSSTQKYALALIGVLLIDPLATLSVGFWLSFGAVGVLLYGMSGRLKMTSLWWKYGRAQWVSFIGLIPFSVYAFQKLSFVSSLANSIAIPWVSFVVVPVAFLGLVLYPVIPLIGKALLYIAEYNLQLLWPFLTWLQHFSFAVKTYPIIDITTILLGVGGVLLCLAPRGLPGRWLGICWLLPILIGRSPDIVPNTFRFTLLDVGQGLSAVIETAQHTLVYDSGPRLNAERDTGKEVVLPYLLARSRNQVDLLLISHSDNDHIGGAESILRTIPVKHLMMSEPQHLIQYHPSNCRAGVHWEWDGVSFDVLHPTRLQDQKRNNLSCVLRVSSGQSSILLTGDIEAPSELQLLQNRYNQLAATVLVVPHHGSRTSSTLPFVQAVAPKYAIFPTGYKNRYGFPKQDILERYHQEKAVTWDTAKEGSISFLLGRHGLLQKPSRYRIAEKHYWNTD